MKDLDQIIIDSLNGVASKEALAELEAWMNASSENEHIYLELVRFYNQENRIPEKSERIWNSFLSKMQEAEITSTSTESIEAKKISLFSRYRIQWAAAVILLISSVSIWSFSQFYPSKITIQTAFGEKKEVSLPDNTIVTLNANSKLTYHKRFEREIWLEGEAFFDVSPRYQSKESFQVHTSDLTIEVLGTSFNVNSHQEETKVFLEEGKIKLDLEDESEEEILMEPGELLVYSAKKGGNFEKTSANALNHTSWTEGAAIMNMIPLKDVLKRMEDIYGVMFKIEDEELLSKEVRVAVPVENLSIAIDALETVLGKKLKTKKENEYFIE